MRMRSRGTEGQGRIHCGKFRHRPLGLWRLEDQDRLKSQRDAVSRGNEPRGAYNSEKLQGIFG